jgi:hypothetical protein
MRNAIDRRGWAILLAFAVIFAGLAVATHAKVKDPQELLC